MNFVVTSLGENSFIFRNYNNWEMNKKFFVLSLVVTGVFFSLFSNFVYAINNDPVKITVNPDNPGVVFDLMNFEIDLKYQDGSNFELLDNPDPDGLFLDKILYVENQGGVVFSEKLYKNNPVITILDGGNRLRVFVATLDLPPGLYTAKLVDYSGGGAESLGTSQFQVVIPPQADEIILSDNIFIKDDVVDFYLFSTEENVAYVPLRYPFDHIPLEGRNYLSDDWNIRLFNSTNQQIKSVSGASIFWEDDGGYTFKVDFEPGKYKLALTKVDDGEGLIHLDEELFFVYFNVVVKGSDPVDAGDGGDIVVDDDNVEDGGNVDAGDDDVVREDMGKFELVVEPDRCADFLDVDKNSKFCAAIVWAKKSAVVKGYFDGTFRPDKDINRVEMLKVVLEALGIEIGKYDTAADGFLGFKDVYTDQWYMPYIKVAKSLKIFVGDEGKGTARPGDVVNRVEAVKLAFEGLRVAQEYQLPVCEIKSYDDIDDKQWYFKYTCKIKLDSLFDLVNPKLLVPGKLSSRGEVVLMLYRLSQAGYFVK